MRLLLSILWLVLVGSCLGANYYVDPENGSDSNNGSLLQPFLTIRKAVYTPYILNAGDTVYLRSGVHSYADHVMPIYGTNGAPSGSVGSPISIAAYPGDSPILNGMDGTYTAYLKNISHYVFDGLTFSNGYTSVYMVDCTNLFWKNCYFLENGTNCNYAGVNVVGTSQFNTFSNCVWYKWGVISGDHQTAGTPFKLGADANPDPQCYYNLVVSNKFLYGMHDNAEAESGYNVWRGNLFVNAPWYSTNGHSTTFYGYNPAWNTENIYGAWGNRNMKPNDGTAGGSGQQDDRNVYEGNTFLYSGPAADNYVGGAFVLGNNRSIFRNNVIAYSLSAGLSFNGSGPTAQSNCVYNNTIYKNGLSWTYGGEGLKDNSYGLRTSSQDAYGGNWIVNNILFQNNPGNVQGLIYTYETYRTNWDSELPDCPDPKFISEVGLESLIVPTNWFMCYNSNNVPNLRLEANSPCIDAGTWLTTVVSESGSGTSMQVENSLYFSDGNKVVSGDTIQLQGQTTRAVITTNDWTNNIITFTPALTWTKGNGVSLAYDGSAPDQGAFEHTANRTGVTLLRPNFIKGK